MRIKEETIDEIRNNANIVDVIGHYIPLEKKGKSYRALCPFHDDHDPSLSISEDKQIYKCFVCGNGGNVFSFVSNYKKCSYIEAVVEVAKIIGKPLDIDYVAPKKENRYQRFYDLLNDYIEYTNYLLTGAKQGLEAKEYLKNRGIEEDIINEFKIGYNPDGDKVYTILKAKEYSDEEMIKVNIERMGASGMSDVFFNRITFPIHDKYGNPIAFTARDFKGFSDAKYINSAQTPIYNKGEILFNYHRAKDSSKKQQFVFVCEGVMDVIAYKRAGIDNVVATLGTACTTNQIALLKELGNKVVLSYDGDRAGKAANIKIGELLIGENINVEVVDNRTGLDPDEIISQYDKNALRDLSSKRLSYIDYAMSYYKENCNLNNYADRKAFALKISALIDKLSDQYDKDNYSNELYELTKIRKTKTEIIDKNKYNGHSEKVETFLFDGLTKAEYIILGQMAISKDAKSIYQKELGYLLDENNNALANLIIEEYRKNDVCHLSKMIDEADEPLKSLIISLGSYESLPEVYDKDVLLGAINRVKEEIKKRKLDDLKKKITDFQTVDPEKTCTYLREYSELLREFGGK